MAVSMADITKLRKMTGAGMMDCKNALTEAEGDFDKAMEIIRKKGQAVAAKRSEREASEGCVLAKTTGDRAVIVALKCETDFVSAAMRPAFLAAAARPFSRRNSIALSKSPSEAVNAFLQSIMPAFVCSRSLCTSFAVNAICFILHFYCVSHLFQSLSHRKRPAKPGLSPRWGGLKPKAKCFLSDHSYSAVISSAVLEALF